MRYDPDTGLGEALLGEAWSTWAVAAGSSVLAFRLEPRGNDAADVFLATSGGASRSFATNVPTPGRGMPPPRGVTIRCASTPPCVVARPAPDGAVALLDIDATTLETRERGTARGVQGKWGIALSFDGSRIAIRDTAGDSFAILARDGSRLGRVAAPAGCFIQYSAFTPHDDALVATMVCEGDEPYQIRRLPLDGSEGRTMATSFGAWFSHPVVSRDGRRLAVAEMPFTGNVEVMELP
jgi:hypothetical protein